MKQFEIIIANLNPVKWSEQSWIRSCIILQNDMANAHSKTFVIAIISSVIKDYPHTLIVEPSKHNWLNEKSRIDLLQIRTIDESRIVKSIWFLDLKYYELINDKIKIAFNIW